MNFIVAVLGSGAATPRLGRHCSAQIVNTNGFKMLVDCGESTQNQIRAYHQKMQSFGTIFISHLHGDHLFGLPGLLSSMHLGGRKEPVNVYAPKGIKDALMPLFEASGTQFEFELNFHELDFVENESREIFRNGRCVVKAFPLYHSIPCYGYLFEEVASQLNLRKGVIEEYQLDEVDIMLLKRGDDITDKEGNVIPNALLTLPPKQPLRYAYCCDTGYREEIIPHIQGVDLLCVESTFDNKFAEIAEQKGHCTAQQAGMLARKANVGKLLLTHFSARYHDVEPLYQEACKEFPNVLIAQDGLFVDVDVIGKQSRGE